MSFSKKSGTGILIMTLISQAACGVFGIRTTEEPKYQVVEKQGDIEIRHYDPYVIAKTTVSGSYRDTQRPAFRILADYIFGKNQQEQEIAMTAPVVLSEANTGQQIAMTAPVVQEETSDGTWTMTFTMPAQYRRQDLPRPLDERITLEEIPARSVATIRYSGRLSEANNARQIAALQKWLGEQPYQILSAPMIAGYDPPWTLPFLRRNEIMIVVAPRP